MAQGRPTRLHLLMVLLAPAAALCGGVLWTEPAHAQSDEASPRSAAAVPLPGAYIHGFATGSIGDSLRFNNPFRLSDQLGSSGESLSRTPLYADLGGSLLFGQPDGWQHGPAFHWSRALGALPQHVVTPGYTLLQGGYRPWLGYARLGLPIVLNPDPGVGTEAALGGAWLPLAGLGLNAELVGDLFYGAATWTTGRTTIPMLSLQIGILVDYEVLP
jgi:hypothetical protein